jgi:hypothetical protein
MNPSNKEDVKDNRAKRGWWFSVMFLLIVVGLILFLTYVKIVDENRDVLVGILGMITGSISSMMAIASGRDPIEVADLKDKLAVANADREALIARFRDCQIQLQLKNEQMFELQTCLIEELSLLNNRKIIKTRSDKDLILDPNIEQWMPSPDLKHDT